MNMNMNIYEHSQKLSESKVEQVFFFFNKMNKTQPTLSRIKSILELFYQVFNIYLEERLSSNIHIFVKGYK